MTGKTTHRRHAPTLYAYTFDPVQVGDRWVVVRKLIHWRPGAVVMTKRDALKECERRMAAGIQAPPAVVKRIRKERPRPPRGEDPSDVARVAAYERLRVLSG